MTQASAPNPSDVTADAAALSATSPASVAPLRWPTASEVLRLRCPLCWRGAMFATPLRMNPTCPSCGHQFDRGHGYFLGAMMFSYALVVLWLALVVAALRVGGFGWSAALVAAALTIPMVGPLVAFPYSRLWWVTIERRMLRRGEEGDRALHAELARRRGVRDAQPQPSRGWSSGEAQP